MSAHSILAPSSMARIVQCPASARLAQQYPEPDDSPEAIEGTLAHSVMSALLLGQPEPAGADDDMREGAAMVAEVVDSRAHRLTAAVERGIAIRRIHDECYGTPDVVVWSNPGVLNVIDYKYGHGFVDAVENWQLMAYAAGLVPRDNDDVVINLTIIQPRNYHRDGPVRTWRVLGSALRAQWNIMRNAATDALSDSPTYRTGPECKHCPARHACPVLQSAALNVCDEVQRATPLDLPLPAAARELVMLQDAAALLHARISGLEAQVSDGIRRGVSVPYWHFEQGEAREKWTVPYEQVKALGDVLGVKVDKPALLTPAQARKAGLPTDGFTERPRGAQRLVADDGRASRVFTQETT